MTRTTRRGFLAGATAAGVTALAGCLDGVGGIGGGGAGAGDEATGVAVRESSVPLADTIRPLPLSPGGLRKEAVSGGPGKDGIPSIDDPSFVEPDAADDFLDPGDVVFGVARDGVAKAYPQKILVHHEICNDTLAGDPVAVTYCPLTGTVLGFDRGGTTFGVSGKLVNNNLVMYDRETEAWWPQVLATSIPGPWNPEPGTASLREFRLVWTRWDMWRDRHPDTRVLSTDTGHARNYDRDPYGAYNPPRGYYARDNTLFPPLEEDGRFGNKRVVMGARTSEGAAAFLKDALREAKLLTGALAGSPAVAVFDPRYDTAFVYRNPDDAPVAYEDGAVRVDGTEYAPGELPLDQVHAFDAMWFAWVGFYPDTAVHE